MIFTLRRIMDKHWKFSKPHIAFIDLKKAFDQVPRSKLWEALGSYNIPEHLLRAIPSPRLSTKWKQGMTENYGFKTNAGVRQRSILSPLQFILYLDLVIKKVAEGHNPNPNEEELQNYMSKWDDCFDEYVLTFNRKKTEVSVLILAQILAYIRLSDDPLTQVPKLK